MVARESLHPVRTPLRYLGLSSLIRRAMRARPIRAALTSIGVATSTLLVLVLLAAFRNPLVSISGYLAQPGLDVWVMPNGTDNLVRTAGFLPMSVVDGVREIDGVVQADPIVRVFVRASSRPPTGPPRDLMLMALGYRIPDGLGGPPEFAAGRAPLGAGEVALDRAAAFRLGVGVDDTIRVNELPRRVVGVTRKTNVLATQFLFFDFEVVEHTSGLTDQTSFIAVRTQAGAAADVAGRIRDAFPGVSVYSDREFIDHSVRESAAGFLPVLLLIAILGVLASALLVALLVQGLVEDRRADIAVLSALGVSLRRIGAAVIVHVWTLVAAGTLLGGLAAVALGGVLDDVLPTIQLAFEPADMAWTLVAFAAAGALGAAAADRAAAPHRSAGSVPLVTALELIGVTKMRGAGRHAVTALTGVSLSVAPGEFVLLQGPSGSGKTTLLTIAAGLLTADQGDVVLAGLSLSRAGADQARRHRCERVGFVFQRANLLPALTASQNVMLAAMLGGLGRDEATQRCDELLESLGVAALAARLPRELSGGEEQRVAVARAVIHRPAVVLADEPTANLDWAAGQGVAERLKSLARERGSAVVVATHDPRLEPYADRVVRLLDGRVV